ncbi:MAG: hypothetical protein ABI175_29670 [Polyangiales bacterium]
MRSLITTSFLAATLAVFGCSAGTDHSVDDETTEGASDALSVYGKKLVGAYKVHTPGSFEIDELVLEAGGDWFWHHNIFCIKAPCPTRDEGKTWIGYAPAKGSDQGRLRLISKTETRQYGVVLNKDGSLTLSRFGASAKFDAVGTYCQEVSDCDGQPNLIMVKCAGGYHSEPVCTDTNSCSKTCVKDEPASKCVDATQGSTSSCKPDTLWKDYASSDCTSRGLVLGKLATRESCGDGVSRYVDYQCCPATAPAPCVIGGCSGQICAETSMISTCIYRPEYACYKSATCERDAAGACGWTKTPALDGCLASGGSCTYSDPLKKYVGYSTTQCSLIRFTCDFASGATYFSDACGCGCLTK